MHWTVGKSIRKAVLSASSCFFAFMTSFTAFTTTAPTATAINNFFPFFLLIFVPFHFWTGYFVQKSHKYIQKGQLQTFTVYNCPCAVNHQFYIPFCLNLNVHIYDNPNPVFLLSSKNLVIMHIHFHKFQRYF